VLQVNSYAVSLPFEYPFTIAKGTKTEQPALLVSLGFGRLQGWGEAPAIRYYDVSVEGMQDALNKVRSVIERYALQDPQRFWHFLHHLLPGQNFLIAALDIAGWDLFSRLRRKPLYAALGLERKAPVLSDYTIGLDTRERMLEKLKAHTATVYKLKLARVEDIDILRALRSATDAPFRVDVNEGWNYEDALRLLPDLGQLGVELLEQPLPKAAWEEMTALKQQSPIPIFADESCVEESDVEKCAAAFHGINIKLTKCGGITPALRMMQTARKLNLQIMLGSMNESSIGTAAMVHLSGAADLLDADGPLLLSGDYADGLAWSTENGMPYYVTVNDSPGLGITMRDNWAEHALPPAS
jgi:L-alanine-DL-glutamate epimerase-like enolase superfamily enzyme